MNKTATGRADLIRCLHRNSEAELQTVAELLGYKLPKSIVEEKQKPVELSPDGMTLPPQEEVPAPQTTAVKKMAMPFYRVVEHRYIEQDYPPGEEPDWFKRAVPMSAEELASDPTASPPSKPPLVRWSRLWPFLRSALGEVRDTGKPDIQKIIADISNGKSLNRLPRKHRPGWAPACQLLLDFSDEMLPFWDDINQLQQALDQLRGEAGLALIMMPDGPEGFCGDRRNDDAPERLYIKPAAGTPVLVLSDLGCQDQTPCRREQWRRFGQRLNAAGIRPIALMPAPQRSWCPDVLRWYQPVCWDRSSHFSCNLSVRPSVIPERPTQPPVTPGVDQLLSLLAPAIRIEPALLRAVRYLLPMGSADVGTEATFWQRREITATVTALVWASKEGNRPWSKRYQQESATAEKAALQQATAALVKVHHAHLSPAIQMEEQYNYSALGQGTKIPEDLEHGMQRLVKTLTHGDFGDSFPMWGRRLWERQSGVLQETATRAAFWLKLHEKTYKQGNLNLPEGMEDIAQASWILDGQPQRKTYQLVLQGRTLTLNPRPQGRLKQGSHLTAFDAAKPLMFHRRSGLETTPPRCINLEQDPGQLLVLERGERLTLKTDCESLQIDNLSKPAWAERIGRDQHGLYAEFTIKGITQRLRWINPGRFMMGSPEGELGRRENETQHEVVLTEGYWLADTPVTQALWQAVMGNFPSVFKGQQRPVETVSWEESVRFIEHINQASRGLDLRLPTEAEWEHACRAGSQTPFSFGENITTDQVNYRGTESYADGERGDYRRKSVDVKALSHNDWGLYQMHGNVWEWCGDRYEAYSSESITNPKGPETGESRVLHGGSWINDGRYVRSAYRVYLKPSFRNHDIGFRLARGPQARRAQ